MRCENCGNEAPQGSAFCNKCGSPLTRGTAPCPHCGSLIPDNSVFCPKCGKMVRNDMADAAPRGATYNEISRQQREQRPAQQRPANAWQPPTQQTPTPQPDDDGDDNQSGGNSTFNRNLLIGAIVAVALVGALLLMRSCGNSESDRRHQEQADSITLANAANEQNVMATFVSELNRNNLLGDGASATSAVLLKGDGNTTPDRIFGITSASEATGRSFFKVYQLTRTGSMWQPTKIAEKYLEGRNITFSTQSLRIDEVLSPRIDKIAGKDYLYFAYMNLLGSEGSSGRVSLNLLDLDAKKLTSLDYVGAVRSRDGRLCIYGKPLDPINGTEREFLKEESQKIGVLYFPTEEELKAEEEAREKEEMEKRMSNPDSADARWDMENKEKMEQARGGEEVTMKRSTYDKPIFRKDDISKQINSEGYSVFLTKSGSVYGFDKNTRKYFTLYAKGVAEIGFNDSKNNLLGIRTTDGGHYQVNLVTGSTKRLNE